MKKYDSVALFSGGLDSILAVRIIQDQGLSVLGLHFVSPFYGKSDDVPYWSETLGLDIEIIDVGEDVSALLASPPPHGFGSVLNPCVDCKILMMRKARAIMEQRGAQFIISGEVLGQRPMSQRRDALNVISREGGVRDCLLRPLCARHMTPIPAEERGFVDRERLRGFSGRGRKDQLALAKEIGLKKIPAPAGGCMLTEKENARRYWPLLEKMAGLGGPEGGTGPRRPTAADFHLSNVGRQLWQGEYWLSIGRNKSDNEAFQSLVRPEDLLLKTVGFPGPLSLLRRVRGEGRPDPAMIREAAALTASYSSKACRAHEAGEPIRVRIRRGDAPEFVEVAPNRQTGFAEPGWDNAREKLLELRRQTQG